MRTGLMNKLFFAIFTIALCMNLNSCKKCTKCSVFDSAGNTIYEDRENCGNKADIEDAKASARDESALLGGSYVCVDSD